MGWKGNMRTVVAIARRVHRNAEQQRKVREREMARQERESLKDDLLRSREAEKERADRSARDAVLDWQEELAALVRAHLTQTKEIDWNAMATTPEPVGSAPEVIEEWRADRDLARRLLAGDENAILEVLIEHKSQQGDGHLGQDVDFWIDGNIVHAKMGVATVDIVPSVRRKQLASGKLSESDMPSGERYDLYQDYVCSVALSIAADLFQILPLPEVFVTCFADMLDTKSGHLVAAPILSVRFMRSTLARFDMAGIDPSDAMANFTTRMDYRRTRGFARIEPILDEG